MVKTFAQFLVENADFGGQEGVLLAEEKNVVVLMLAKELAVLI